MTKGITLPVVSHQVGAIGEALFKNPATQLPVEIRETLLDHCSEHCPEWVILDGISFYIEDTDKRYIAVVDGDEIGWDCDAVIQASYNHSFQVDDLDYFEFKEKHGTTTWEYEFLVEIKTGGASLDYDNQREVMKHYSDRNEMQSFYIHIEINSLPDEYKIDDWKLIG